MTQQLRHAAFQTRPPTTLQPRPISATHFSLPASHALRIAALSTFSCRSPGERPSAAIVPTPSHPSPLNQAIRISTRKGSMIADQIETHPRCRYGTNRCIGQYVSLSKRQWDYKSIFNSSTITTTNVNATPLSCRYASKIQKFRCTPSSRT